MQLKRETQREIFSCDLEIQLVERSAFNETDLSSFTPLIRGWNPERNLNISRSKAIKLEYSIGHDPMKNFSLWLDIVKFENFASLITFGVRMLDEVMLRCDRSLWRAI